MDVLQVWMLIGVPSVVLGAALLMRRSPWRSVLGYLVLFAGFGGMAAYDRTNAAVFGGLIALVFAAGRGGSMEHEDTRVDEFAVPDASLHPKRRAAQG